MKNAVKISNLYWRFPTFTGIKKEYVLRNVNLEIREGELFGITGSTGSGKTTLCYVIAGLIPHGLDIEGGLGEEHLQGRVTILGKKITELVDSGDGKVVKTNDIEPGRVGLVRQDPEGYFSGRSAMEELSSQLKKLDLPRKEIEKRIKSALKTVQMEGILEIARKVRPSELSTGEQKRLVIASFLAMKPDILILDEPTSDLDPASRSQVIEAILAMKREGNITIILVEQDSETLTKLADRMAVMYKGEVVAVDKPDAIYSRSDIRKFIDVPELMELMGPAGEIDNRFAAGRVKDFRVSRLEREKGEILLGIENLEYYYEDGTKAIDKLDLKVHKGEFLSLVGGNGSGKSTLSKIISGNLTGWSGKVEFNDQDSPEKRLSERMRKHIGYVFQNPDQQVLQGTVRDEMYSNLNIAHPEGKNSKGTIEDALRKVNLNGKMEEDINSLSRGEKRRLALASVLVAKPQVLIVDEPATGQDYRGATEIMDLLTDLNNSGTTVIIITHDMRLVAEYTRRTVVMKGGRVIFDGAPEGLFQDDRLMQESSLAPPQLVRISRKLKDSGVIQDILLNAKEWLELFRFESEKKNFEAMKFVDLKRYARDLASEIVQRYGKPESIVYIERGGMVIGRLLSDYLSVRQIYPLKASYYTDDGIPLRNVRISQFEYSFSDNEGYILLVDDIADTGKTLKAALDSLQDKTKRRIVTATVVYKPQSVLKPDVYVYTVENDTWIVFDYEEVETLSRFMRKDNAAGLKFMKDNF